MTDLQARDEGHTEAGVLVGRDGTLFLSHGHHAVLDYITGKRVVTDASFAAFKSNMQTRFLACQRVGAQYLHVIFPDKHSALRHAFPVADFVSLNEIYRAECEQAFKRVLNLGQTLARHDECLFKTTDTHMNDVGSAVAAAQIASAVMNTPQTAALASILQRPRTTRRVVGDLGRRMIPVRFADESEIVTDWPVQEFTNELPGNDGMTAVAMSPEALHDKRVLLFGDSFGRDAMKFLTYFFREIVFLRSRFLHEEMVQQIKPDIVLTEQVERYLATTEWDREAPPFLLYPALKEKPYAPSAEFLQALTAVMSYPKPPYLRFMRRVERGQLSPATA